MTKLEALLEIATVLAPKSKSARARVELAFIEPKAYVRKYARQLNERNIERPIPALPWIALIDALEAAKVLVEIDWKTDSDEVEAAIRKLKKGFTLPPIDELDDRSTWELLELAGAALRKQGLQLGQLDMSSDNHCLVVVPKDTLSTLVRLGKTAKFGRVEAFGDRLGAATKERVARARRLEREAEEEAKRPKPTWRFFVKGKACWSLLEAPAAFTIDFYAPGVKWVESHTGAEPKPLVKRLIAEWRAGGFEELSEEEWRARFSNTDTGYLGWVGPFPEDGVYFLETPTLVRCLSRGEGTVVTARGVIGKNFGELLQVRHSERVDQDFEAEVNGWRKARVRELSRDEVIRRYAKKK